MLHVRVTGEAGVRAALAHLRASMHAGADEGQQAAAQAVSEQWKAGAPVETGKYRREIDYDGDGAFSPTEYAPFVEFGTSTRPAQPAGSEAAARGERSMPAIVAAKVRRRLP